MPNSIKGWKTVTGAIIYGLGEIAIAAGMPEYGVPAKAIGGTLAGYGIADKLVKLGGK